MTEQYEQLANELVQVNEALLHQPAQDLLSKLSRGEPFVLNYLLTHYGQAHPTDLSRHMVVSTARIAALLNRMEEKGLISRLPTPWTTGRSLSPYPLRARRPLKHFAKKSSKPRPVCWSCLAQMIPKNFSVSSASWSRI